MAHDVLDQHEAQHSPRVARNRQARMRDIVCCALETLRHEGSEALTLKRLAERLGLTSAAFYRYFPSKVALDAELQRAVIATLVANVRSRTDDADAFAKEQRLSEVERTLLEIVVTALVFEAFAHASPAEFGFLTANLSTPEFTLPDREAAHVFETAWSALAVLGQRIEEAQTCCALTKGAANERAVALWAALQGVVQTRKLVRSARDRIDPTKLAHDLVMTLLVGWGADTNTTRRVLEIGMREGFADDLEPTLDFLRRDRSDG